MTGLIWPTDRRVGWCDGLAGRLSEVEVVAVEQAE
jgi:hypothetical protein